MALSETVVNGGHSVPLHLISETDPLTDLHVNYEHGNHQSTIYSEKHLTNMLMDEVSWGWQPILPREVVLQLPRAILAPLGLVEQNTINKFGNIVLPKWQLTHDQSFNVIKKTSHLVND